MGHINSNKAEQNERINNKKSQELGNVNKTKWSKELIYTLYDLCIKHTIWSKGKNGAITSHKILWPKLVDDWKKVTNLPWDKSRLKNKLDGMRPKWILWKNLKSKETELRWDHEKRTINASDEWWSLKIQENPKYESFKDEGIEPELEIKMDQVFGGCDQGAEKFILLGIPLDFRVDNEVNSNVRNDEGDSMCKESNPTSPIVDTNDKKKGKRIMEKDTFESNKSAKVESTKPKGGSFALLEKMDSILQMISDRNKSSKDFQATIINMINSMSVAQSKYPLADAIRKLCTMSGFDSSSPEFYYACTLIEDAQKRTIFLELPDDKMRIEYIRYMYAQHKG